VSTPVVKRFEEDEVLLLRELEHGARLLGRVGRRLFNEDVFASSKCLHGPFIMKPVQELRKG